MLLHRPLRLGRARFAFAACFTFAALSVTATSLADWPMAKHDAKRQSLATGSSDIKNPVAYWKRYLGGSIGAQGMLVADVAGDAKPEVVYVTGGRVVAKLPDDTVVWETPPLEIGSLIGIDDFDGNGKPDIAVSARNRALILAGSDGSLQWAEPEGEMGTLGGARMGDVNGDGRPDLVIVECACCGVNSGNLGFTYSFGPGFAPTLLWPMPVGSCGFGRTVALVDLDGTGASDVVTANQNSVAVVDGSSGAVLAQSASLGTRISESFCRGANIDGAAGDEIICLLNSSSAPLTDQRKVYALKYVAQGQPLQLLWKQTLAPDVSGDAAWIDPIVDLDGDGTLEVVAAGKDAADVWTTFVFDAATGAVEGQLPGQRLAGTANLSGAANLTLLTSAGTSLSAYTFNPMANPSLTFAWSLTDRRVVVYPDPARIRTTGLSNVLGAVDVTNDMASDLVTITTSGVSKLTFYAIAANAPNEVANYGYPADVDPIVSWIVPPTTEMYPQLAVARNDGFLTFFDNQLKPTNEFDADRPGLRIGGYYAAGAWRDLQRSPVIADIDGSGAQAIVVRDSRGALLRLNAKDASLGAPPKKVWQKTHATAPTIVDKLDAMKPGIACIGTNEPVTNPPTYYMASLRADGTEIWKQPIPTQPHNDILPGNFDGDTTPDLVVNWADPGDQSMNTRAYSGLTGATLWNGPSFVPGSGLQPAGLTVADWDGDMRDDVLQQGATSRIFSGMTGQSIKTGGPSDSYFMLSLFDIDGNGIDEIIHHGGFSPTRVYDHDLTAPILVGGEDDRPYPYASFAVCPNGPVMITESWQFPSRLKVTQLSGATAGTFQAYVLAGGKKYPNENTAKADGARMGQLSSSTVHKNLAGDGKPVAFVGSADGHLYAIDPCANELKFSINFNAAVGEAVFGDTDGDGRDEIIVSVADGFLYGLRQNVIDGPSVVNDTNPDANIFTDVDSITTMDKLSCGFPLVPGAIGYEVAVVDKVGNYVTAPAWTATTMTNISFPGLALVDGARYYCAVRALDAQNHASVDTLSDGVTVVFPLPGTGGSGGTGGTAGTGGVGGIGGSGGTAGTQASGGTGGTTASTTSTGGAGTGAAGGAGGSGGGGTSSSGGCGCHVVDPAADPRAWLVGLGALAGWMRRRRKRS
ncbi:MAG: VCBS repeat-containing protein [Polyangiaceae bacterium]|nr:VCBS repeat-containing protein [Polyangiaceae bacterium]